MREFEARNHRLKHLLADTEFVNAAIKVFIKGTYGSPQDKNTLNWVWSGTPADMSVIRAGHENNRPISHNWRVRRCISRESGAHFRERLRYLYSPATRDGVNKMNEELDEEAKIVEGYADLKDPLSTFRQPMITAASLVLGFTLGFASQWVAVPNPLGLWADYFVGLCIVVGTCCLVMSVFRILRADYPRDLPMHYYAGTLRLFVAGIAINFPGLFSDMFITFFSIGR